MSVIEVWQEPSGFWRWRYTEPPPRDGEVLQLLSNEVYDSREEAVEAAMTAYPGIPVRELGLPPGAAADSAGRAGESAERAGKLRRPRRRWRVLTLLGAGVALLALRSRRRRRPARPRP